MNKEYREWWIFEGSGMRPLPQEDMEQFAMRIAEIAWSNGAYKEREACAKVCESMADRFMQGSPLEGNKPYASHECAKAIRARGE